MHELGTTLLEAGLSEAALADVFGPAWTSDDVPLVLDRYRAGDPRAALVRLFVLGEPVETDALPVSASRLVDAGLVELDGATARARVGLAPFAGMLVAHEPRVADAQHVAGVNAASRTLATLTVRRPVERALDIGTGCGVEALLASRHAKSVVATDVNARALEYAALSARLNGVELDLRLGSLFEPVDGERFDLIVANPPFVVSPDNEFVYRDSGRPGDSLTREVVRGAARHLRPGGYATVLCNWICHDREERWEPLAEWVEGLDCDALLIAHGIVDPLRYASRWNEPHRSDPAAYARAVGRWLDHYEREGIVGVGVGAVVLRGREDPGWVRGFSAPAPAAGAAGPHLERLFAGADRLDRLGRNEELLDDRYALVSGHRLDQTLVFDSGYEVAGVRMLLAEGVGLVADLDPAVVPLLFELAPTRTIAAAAAAAELEPSDVLPAMRRLVELGMLEEVRVSRT